MCWSEFHPNPLQHMWIWLRPNKLYDEKRIKTNTNKWKMERREETVQSSPASAFFVFFIYLQQNVRPGEGGYALPFCISLQQNIKKKERNCACEHWAAENLQKYKVHMRFGFGSIVVERTPVGICIGRQARFTYMHRPNPKNRESLFLVLWKDKVHFSTFIQVAC